MPRLLGVSLPWATFGLLFDEGDRCIEAAPVARWCQGKSLSYLLAYWQRRGAQMRWID